MPHSRRSRVQKTKRQTTVLSTATCKVSADSESDAVNEFAKIPMAEAFAKYDDQRVEELLQKFADKQKVCGVCGGGLETKAAKYKAEAPRLPAAMCRKCWYETRDRVVGKAKQVIEKRNQMIQADIQAAFDEFCTPGGFSGGGKKLDHAKELLNAKGDRLRELVTSGSKSAHIDVLSSKKGSEFVYEYQRLPQFPTEGKLDISEIRCYGLKGAVKCEGVLNSPVVQYGEFNRVCAEEYLLIQGRSEYAANEYVTPVVICCIEKKVYRTLSRYWFPLSDCCLAIELREKEGNPAKFPFTVRYGGYEELMKKLFNYIGVSYLKRVPAQGCLYRVGDKDIDELGNEY